MCSHWVLLGKRQYHRHVGNLWRQTNQGNIRTNSFRYRYHRLKLLVWLCEPLGLEQILLPSIFYLRSFVLIDCVFLYHFIKGMIHLGSEVK